MAANTSPIWTLSPDIGWALIPNNTANTNTQSPGTIDSGVAAGTVLAFSSGVNGSYLQKIRFQFTSTTSVISSVATVLQVYISSVNTVGAALNTVNTTYFTGVQAAAQTLSAVTTAPYVIEIPLNFAIPASRYILVSQSVAQTANSGWMASVIGGDY
jgi:hypothetical protein